MKDFIEIVNDSLDVLRKKFAENQELLDRVRKAEDGGGMSGTFNTIELNFDYVEYIRLSKKGFYSPILNQLFEIMMYTHYFEHLHSYDVNLKEYVNYDVFDEEKFKKEVTEDIPVLIAINVVKKYADSLFKDIKITDSDEMFNDSDYSSEMLKTVKYAMHNDLHPFGDYGYLLSKIPIKGECEVEYNIPTIDQVFYTYKPEHIIDMAHVVRPGIYIIANVPYERKGETAFYILFRFTKGAYLVENAKHSYREQHYRNKSDGTDGEDAWLYKKYDTDYLPVDVVLSFFENKSDGKDITLPGTEQSFRTLGKLSETTSYNILWMHAFIDKCMQEFKAKKFEPSVAMSMEFVIPQLEKDNSKVPALYQEHVPAIADINLDWAPYDVEVTDELATYLEPHLPDSPLNLDILPTGKLVPMEHLKRELVYRKRMQESSELEEQLEKDFVKNFDKVMKRIDKFVRSKGNMEIVKKALLNKRYPMTRYAGFAESFDGDNLKFDEIQILHGYDLKENAEHFVGYGAGRHKHIVFPQDPYIQNHKRDFSEPREVVLSGAGQQLDKRTCVCCNKRNGRYFYNMQFLDYLQFEAFFKLTKTEINKMPQQFRDYLNQQRLVYNGNSILDDVDPLSEIHNPWWTDSIDQWGKLTYKNYHAVPGFFIIWNLCKICKNKIDKEMENVKTI